MKEDRDDLVHVLLRRWLITLCGLAVTGGLLALTLVLVPLKYTATADVLLLPPKSQSTDNPLLGLGDLEDVPATIARSALNDASVQALAERGVTGGYAITVDLTTSAPLLLVTATESSREAALDAMEQVAALVPETLQRLQRQQNVRSGALITSSVIHADQQPTAVTRTRTRILLATAALGLLLTGLVAIGADRLILRSRVRARAALEPSAVADPTVEPPHQDVAATATEDEPRHRIDTADEPPSAVVRALSDLDRSVDTPGTAEGGRRRSSGARRSTAPTRGRATREESHPLPSSQQGKPARSRA